MLAAAFPSAIASPSSGESVIVKVQSAAASVSPDGIERPARLPETTMPVVLRPPIHRHSVFELNSDPCPISDCVQLPLLEDISAVICRKLRVLPSGCDGFDVEFQALQEATKRLNLLDDRFYSAIHNQPLNRYRNVLAVESTRVRLPNDSTGRGDYINANYLDAGPNPRIERVYISTQGPKAETVVDFWRMIVHAQSSVIVMLTRVREAGMDKCHSYWPEVEQEHQYGPYVVTCTLHHAYESEITARVFAIRDLSAPEPTVRHVTHFHYEGWPDNGVPSTTHGLRRLIQLVDECRPSTPITVHCSAGIGRAGAFCTVHVIVQRLKCWLSDVHKGATGSRFQFDVFETVKFLRAQRPGIIVEKSQYVFVYLTLRDIAEQLVGSCCSDLV